MDENNDLTTTKTPFWGYLAGIMVVVILTVASIFYVQQNRTDLADNDQNQENQGEIAGQNTIYYLGEDGKSALTILKERETVETKSSSLGEYVDSINGIKGGTDGKYWILYVNGEMSQIGADQYQTQITDIIEWRFE